MKHIAIKLMAAFLACNVVSSCIEEVDPQSNIITGGQASDAPGAFDNFVDAITSNLVGQFLYRPNSTNVTDAGYPCFFLERDALGQDIAVVGKTTITTRGIPLARD